TTPFAEKAGRAGPVAATFRVTGMLTGERSGAVGVRTMAPLCVPAATPLEIDIVNGAGVCPADTPALSQLPPDDVDADTAKPSGTTPAVETVTTWAAGVLPPEIAEKYRELALTDKPGTLAPMVILRTRLFATSAM